MTPTLADLFASPDHYLHAFAGEDAVFVPMNREAYRRSIFLDQRIETAAPGALRMPIDALLAQPAEPQPAAWIFHIAHCGSTLLARALDELAGGLVLREPLALRQVAVSRAGALLPLVLAMAGKRYSGAGPTIVKANVPVNFILADIAALAPPAGSILLYMDWREYLLAILRSADHRAWLRSVSGALAAQVPADPTRGDAELAAALWAAQIARFAEAAEAHDNARALDAEKFFADPRAVLPVAARVLGHAAPAGEVERVVTGPLFSSYSKNPGAAFGNAERLARQAAAERELGGELAAAEAWLSRYAPHAAEQVRNLQARALGI